MAIRILGVFSGTVRRLAATVAIFFALMLPVSTQAGELEDRNAIEAEVIAAFLSRDYARLEGLSTRYASTSERTASGLWKLSLFQGAFNDLQYCDYRDEDRWKSFEELALGWTTAYPRSPGAHIVVAEVYFAHGRAYRGSDWAHNVPPENWKPYREYLVKARNYLLGEAAFAAADPRHHDLMLTITSELQVPEAEFQALAEKAMTANPGYYQIYFTIMNHYLPKWGGDVRAVEDFARAAAKFTRTSEGDGMYARIYWAASQYQFGAALFTHSEANWSDMKRGIIDVLARYDDDWNVNHFAKFACLAGDRQMTAELMARIDSKPLAAAWEDVPFAECERWVRTPQ